jgi:L-ascorbate 6-phosphate lactonase
MPGLVVEWLGQAGFVYRFPSGASVCVDPYLSHALGGGETAERLAPIPVPAWELGVDVVVTTHDHADHFDEVTLRPIAESSPRTVFAGPSSCREHWLRMGLPAERFLRLDRGESVTMGSLRLAAVYAEHDSGGRRDAVGVVAEADGWRVYQVGDSEYVEPLVAEVAGLAPDLMVVPINGRLGNMGHREAARLAKVVGPRVVVPMHYGMFRDNTADPQDFLDACREGRVGSRVVVPVLGAPFALEAPVAVPEEVNPRTAGGSG